MRPARPPTALLLEPPIRVLLTHPYGWPHVRRGAEREAHELAGRLCAAGHDARLLTGMPRGLLRSGRVAGAPVRWVRTPRLPGPQPGPAFAAAALVGALAGRPDVVHCLHYADAYGAGRVRAPMVLKLTGTVLPERVRGLDARLLHGALHRAAEVWVNSSWAAESMSGFGVPMRVVPAGLDTSRFRPAPRADRPLVVCAAAAEEPRKRVTDLLAAWPSVRAALPDAVLVLAGPPRPGLPEGVRCTGVLDDEALAALYARAWVVVAPAVHEALGLVTLEALSSGTPVAGVRSGATPQLLAAPGTGALAEPLDPGSLAEAVVAAAALSQEPATAARCRAAAAPYDWDVVLPQVLEGYRRVLG